MINKKQRQKIRERALKAKADHNCPLTKEVEKLLDEVERVVAEAVDARRSASAMRQKLEERHGRGKPKRPAAADL